MLYNESPWAAESTNTVFVIYFTVSGGLAFKSSLTGWFRVQITRKMSPSTCGHSRLQTQLEVELLLRWLIVLAGTLVLALGRSLQFLPTWVFPRGMGVFSCHPTDFFLRRWFKKAGRGCSAHSSFRRHTLSFAITIGHIHQLSLAAKGDCRRAWTAAVEDN